MAIYHFHQSVVSGGAGQSAVASAAYRHGARMERIAAHQIADYERKQDCRHSEVAIPSDAPEWVRAGLGLAGQGDRLTGPEAVRASEILWNTVETGEKSANAKYAINLVLALPRELSPEQNIALVRAFVEENYTSKGRIADWALHMPPGKEYNPHVHIATTVRPLTQDGFGAKNIRIFNENGEPARSRNGHAVYEKFAGSKPELMATRASWASEVNHHLALAGYDITVDHRSFQARGIDDSPTYHRGKYEYASNLEAGENRQREDAATRLAVYQSFRDDPGKVLDRILREQSTFSMADARRTIGRYAPTRAISDELLMHVGEQPNVVLIQAEIHDPVTNIVVQEARFTTKEVLKREAMMGETARILATDLSHAVQPELKAAALAKAENAQGFAYTPEQRAAVDRLTTEAGMAIMVGIAGAGKSTVMRAVNEIYADETRSVYGGALAGKAASNLQDSSGIESRTLASWELAWSNGFSQLRAGDVFVIDEAGMVASEQMGRVLTQLKAFDAKVILIGDAKQLQPIEAGAAFRSLAAEIGYVELTEVRRQERDDHAYASVLFGAGDTKAALDIYRNNDAFWFHDKRQDAWTAAVDGWREDWRAGVDVVMLAHTNRDILALNTLAREAIKQEGGLQTDHRFMTARGAREFAEGDRLMFLKNDRGLQVINGTIGTVEAIRDGELTISIPGRDTPIVLTRDGYNNIDHGYAQTIHKSQGTTYDRVHVVATGGMDAQLSYVALSRHREDVTVHVASDAFVDYRTKKPLTEDQIIERLATDALKDTSLDYRSTLEYAEAKAEIELRTRHERMTNGWFEAFLDRRGLPHPSEILQAVKDFAADFLRMDRSALMENQIIVGERGSRDRPVAAVDLTPPETLRHAIHRLEQAQSHSAAMNHEGHPRRSALLSAENELTHATTAQTLSDYARMVARVIPPSVAVAIGPTLEDAHSEPRLAALSPEVRDSLQANWMPVHAVLRASWELGNLEFARSVDTSYRQERDEAKTLADYERHVAGIVDPEPAPGMAIKAREYTPPTGEGKSDVPFVPAFTHWPETVEEAVAKAILTNADVLGFLAHARRHADTVWRDPAVAIQRIEAALALRPNEAPSVLYDLAEKPETCGELRGGRTLLRKPDAERQTALDAVPLALNMMGEAHGWRRRLVQPLREQEAAWRVAMSKPIPSLSREAQGVVSELNRAFDMKRPDREPAHMVAMSALTHRTAWSEVKAWRKDVQERLGKPGAIDRLPGLSKDARDEIKATIAKVEVAVREGENTRRIEIMHERSRQASLDRGYGY